VSEDRVERRLSAMMAADVAGYSRLMEADEAGTLARLKTARAEAIDPALADHGGRLVTATGDGLLVAFPSAVAAVECAVSGRNEEARLKATELPSMTPSPTVATALVIRHAAKPEHRQRLADALRAAGVPSG
jgi:class 3 adenylate cyclase